MINGKIIQSIAVCEKLKHTDVEAIEGIDMLGFIFYPKSPRCVYELPAYLPTHARRVGALSMKISKWSACMLIVSD